MSVLRIWIVLFVFLSGGSLSLSGESSVELTTSLAADSVMAKKKNLPLLLMISGIDCSFCYSLKDEYLNPMLRNTEYSEKVIMRELIIDDDGQIEDFNGELISSSQISLRYNVDITPTILFIDAYGKELTERVIGYTTPEMYGYYLDQGIDSALANLRLQTDNQD